jgi:hypothetical protein
MGKVMGAIKSQRLQAKADGALGFITSEGSRQTNDQSMNTQQFHLLSHATKQILDTWGSDGWELVQVSSRTRNW